MAESVKSISAIRGTRVCTVIRFLLELIFFSVEPRIGRFKLVLARVAKTSRSKTGNTCCLTWSFRISILRCIVIECRKRNPILIWQPTAICIPGLIRLHVLHHAAEEPDLRARHDRRTGAARLPHQSGQPVSTASRAGEEGLSAFPAAAQRQIPAQGLSRDRRSDGRRWKHPRSKCANCFGNSWKANSGVKRKTFRLSRFSALAVRACHLAQADSRTTPLTVGQAVQRALRNYPSVRVSQEQINAAAAGIRLARTAYLPHAGRARPGQPRHPQQRLRPAAAPEHASLRFPARCSAPTISAPTWGRALGVLVSWEPFDFGLRRANLAVASALEAESEAALKRTAVRNRRSHRRRLSHARRRAGDHSHRAGRRGPRRASCCASSPRR